MSASTVEKNPTSIKFWRRNPKAIEKFSFVYHFLPHPEERRRASLLSHKALITYCLLILLITGVFRLIPAIFPGVLGYASNITVRDLLNYTNKRRMDAGLSELRLNTKLSEAAAAKAANMFTKNYWAHVAPDGTEPWDFILKQGYDYTYAGENLAKNFSTSKDVVQAWMDSPSHKENMLSPNYDEVGFAVVNGTLDNYETTLVVQMFGRPRDKKQVATVDEQDSLLNKISSIENEKPSVASSTITPNGGPELRVEKISNPLVDIKDASKTVTMIFGGFVSGLLALDIWYSRKKGILKFTGHTFAHLTILVLVIFCVWFVIKPGLIL